MKDKTKEQLMKELEDMRQQTAELKASETKREQMEEALKESEEKLKIILENVHDVIFQLSPSGLIQYVSPKVKEIYGYNPKDLIGKHLKKTTPLSEVPKALEAMKRVLSGKTIKNFEINQLDSKGKIVSMEIYGTPVKEGGKIIGVQGVMRDITERKQAEKQLRKHHEQLEELVEERTAELQKELTEREKAEKSLRESEEDLKAIFDGVADGIALVDMTGKVTKVNKRIMDIGGYTEKEIIGKRIGLFKMFPLRSRAKMLLNFAKLILGQQVPPFDVEVHTKTGEKLVVELRGSRLRKRGKIVGMIGVMRDVTQRKQAEEALQESEEKYRTLVETLQEGMTVVDPYENIIFANSSFCDILGCSREEIIGMNLRSVLSEEEFQKILQETEKRKKGISSKYEMIVKRKDGELRSVIVSATPLMNEKGEFQRTIGMMMDITERKKIDNKLKQLNETLRLINKIMRHDILNDLQIVIDFLDTYAETKDETFLNKSTDRINKNIKLIGRMSELESLVTSGDKLVKYSVKEVVEDTIKNYLVDFKVKGNCIILADGAFPSVIDNIIRNAIVHGKTDKIDITTACKDDICEIRIADYGIGIPDKIKERVFDERFSYGKTGGTGLGLYIVKKTVDRYGGNIHIEDNEPNGAVVCIRLTGVKRGELK